MARAMGYRSFAAPRLIAPLAPEPGAYAARLYLFACSAGWKTDPVATAPGTDLIKFTLLAASYKLEMPY
jgi:hypothetical protein